MTSAPVLAIPNFREPFLLETDAFGSSIGTVLSQSQHPIAYFSKKLSPRMQKQYTYTREFYVINEAMAKFRHYLLGHKFIIRTDQKSLKELLEQTLQTPEQQQWLPKFLGYNFTIQYKPSRKNIHADALSRSLFIAWSEPTNHWLAKVVAVTKEDKLLSELISCYDHGGTIDPKYDVKDGLIFRKGKLMIPENSALRNQILQEFHDTKMRGHVGRNKIIARICSQFYWPKMQEDIKSYIRCCSICQQAKVDQAVPTGLLQPLPIPQQIWEDIAMDFITNLPSSHGYSTIMVIVDRLSKFGRFIALKAEFNSKLVADAFINHVAKIHGFPKSIVYDRDRVFINSFWQQLFKAQGTTLAMSSSYHPQNDAQTKILNKTLEMYLRCFVFDNPKLWYPMLAWAQYWYNSSYHHSLDMSPFKDVFGREPPAVVPYQVHPKDPISLQETLVNRDNLL